MNNSPLISLLRTLSNKEIKELDRAIDSPVFNSQKTVKSLYTHLRVHYPDFAPGDLNRELLFKHIYPGKAFNAELIRRVMSDLKKSIEEFIVYRKVMANEIKTSFIKAEDYLERELYAEAEKNLDKAFRMLDSAKISAESLEYFIRYFALRTRLYFSRNKQENAAEEMRQQFLLNYYHFILRNAYNLHDVRVNKIIFNSGIENELVNKLLNTISYTDISSYLSSIENKNRFQKVSLVYILGIVNYMNGESSEYYEPLINSASDAIEEFSTEEKYNVYQMLKAVTWYKIKGENALTYRKELFRINKMRLEDGVFSPDGKYMRLMLYRQILMTAITLKEFEWTEKFVNDYSGKLPVNCRDNMRNFSFSQICFEQNKFEESLNLISKVNFDLFTLKLDVRNLMLKIYYELGFYEEAFSLMDSYRHFLSENKNVSEFYKDLAGGFLNYYAKLVKLKMDRDGEGAKLFRSGIIDNPVWHMDWISKKAEELIHDA